MDQDKPVGVPGEGPPSATDHDKPAAVPGDHVEMQDAGRCRSCPAGAPQGSVRNSLDTIPSSQILDSGEHAFSGLPHLTKFSLDSSMGKDKNGKGEASLNRHSAAALTPSTSRPIKRVSLVRASMGSAIAGNVGTAPQLRLIDAARKTIGGETKDLLGEQLEAADAAVLEAAPPTMIMGGPLCGCDPFAKPQPWWQQITLRSLVVGAVLGFTISVVMMNLNLTTGIIPSLNIAAGILGFFLIKTWVSIGQHFQWNPFPFTPQENTVVQTCVVSCYGLAFSGGFGSYLLAMDKSSYLSLGSMPGNDQADTRIINLQRTIPYMFGIGFLGIFILVQFRKTFIIDYDLPYPSGTATGILISSFHTPKGAAEATAQVKRLGVWGGVSFCFSFFKWFFTAQSTMINGKSVDCMGWDSFPSLGLQALDHNWNFDFALEYIGAGLICPHEVNYSLMAGAILSWGILWPYIKSKEGQWFEVGASSNDFRGFAGYKNFIAIAVFMGDGAYNMLKVMLLSALSYRVGRQRRRQDAARGAADGDHQVLTSPGGTFRVLSPPAEDPCETKAAQLKALRKAVFQRDSIPVWFSCCGVVFCVLAAVLIIPHVFPYVRWYYILVALAFIPFFSVANSYGAGLTDWNMASVYGKIAIFCFAAWAGSKGGGIIAGLGMCGVLLASTNAAADLMQDFRTGFITLSSPRSMFAAQLVGALFGAFIGPLSFAMFQSAFPVGDPDGPYPAPYAALYRSMAIIGVSGFNSLPKYCVTLMTIFFVASIVLCLAKDLLPRNLSLFVPIPAAAAITFYVGPTVAVDMVIGSVIKAVWERRQPADAELSIPAAASGLICGTGLWAIPASILALSRVNPPICMFFGPGE